MISMKEAIAIMQAKELAEGIEVKRFKSERSELLATLYEFYERDYKKSTRQRYFQYLQSDSIKHSQENLERFKKSPYYKKKITIKSFCSFWVSHIPTSDLHYLISIARDKEQRRESFNKWLFWALKTNGSIQERASVHDPVQEETRSRL